MRSRKVTHFWIILVSLLMFSCGGTDIEHNTSESTVDAARMMVLSEGDGYVTTLQTLNNKDVVKSDFENETVFVRMMITNVSAERRRLEYIGPRVAIYRKLD